MFMNGKMQTRSRIKLFLLPSIIMMYALLFAKIIPTPTSSALSIEKSTYPFSSIIQPEIWASMSEMQADEKISVVVTLKEQLDFVQYSITTRSKPLQEVILALKERADLSQKEIMPLLKTYQRSSEVEEIVPFWIFNGFSMRATPQVISELAAHPNVLKISPDQIELVPSIIETGTIYRDNLSLINAPLMWEQGWLGQGVVVASMDTGVDLNHPDLRGKWRGGGNSWYDPFGKHDVPIDYNGHGTMTMGVILGGDASETAIGVAPLAEWISVKIFDDDGSSTATAVHLGFQWLLDPDNDPLTDDAPHIVNNSWSFANPGCNPEFLLDVQAIRAAGILPVFSGGNFGPNENTSVSPANYPEALAVGAVTNDDLILSLSSRGPSMCAEEESIYPEITAPGYKIFTSDLYGFYTTATGTSLAAPHVTGSLALLLSAFPSMTIEDQQKALIENAVDLGEFGPDHVYGYGRVDVDRSFQAIYDSGIYLPGTPVPFPMKDFFSYFFPLILHQ